MAYHKHPERTFYTKDFLNREVRVDRREDTIFLNGSPIIFVRLHKDKSVEVHTSVMSPPQEGYIFNGFDIWRMLHDEEMPSDEYAGYLEAQLLGIKLLANIHNLEWMQQQTLGRGVDE